MKKLALLLLPLILLVGCTPDDEQTPFDPTVPKVYEVKVNGAISILRGDGQIVDRTGSGVDVSFSTAVELTIENTESGETWRENRNIVGFDDTGYYGQISHFVRLELAAYERIVNVKLISFDIEADYQGRRYRKSIRIRDSLWDQVVGYTTMLLELGIEETNRYEEAPNVQVVKVNLNKDILLK